MIPATKDQVSAAVTAATAERDAVQANLLDLDGSFGKRLLAGATLTGETQRRWEIAAGQLAALWDTFTAYSAVVDRAAELLATVRRGSDPRLSEIASLLSGPSVRLTRAVAPLARRELTGSSAVTLTPAAAVQEMKGAFGSVTSVVTTAETVWNEVADRLQRAGTDLGTARQQASGLTDDDLNQALGLAEADLIQLRDVLNSDPLAFWQRGQVDLARLDRLRDAAATAAAAAAAIAGLRDDAGRRIAAATAAVRAVAQARQDALTAQQRTLTKVAATLASPPGLADLERRLAGLSALQAAGRWGALESELDEIDRQAAAAAAACREAERVAGALLERREELRGLLDAYQARAARLGAAEDPGLTTLAARARELLWTAPCDLGAASAAVTSYQQAVLALSRQVRP
jgi:hypothetical protein